ncbi:MAG: amino acid permease [Desulforhopalus sp.]
MRPSEGTEKIREESEKKGKLGTFGGVFTPSILTILGIILFLRLGYVTGSAGVARTMVIIGLANLITILTSQSLAAIATNLKVKGGGDYYLISRTLGKEFGGAIGLVLYLAQSVSVAFYCIGFAEALSAILGPSAPLSPQLIAAAAMGAIFALALIGADWATKFQYLVMLLLVSALVSFFVGGIPQWQSEVLLANWAPGQPSDSFWIIFGIFFPAVTGFTQGVSMSGDLKDPGKSLPLGTFMAVGLSIVIYTGVVIIFAGVLPNRVLVDDYMAIKQVARYDFLIDAGVIAATLSSAMASFLGGPRILQSLAADKIFPILTPFAKVAGSSNNPRRAVCLTGAIALSGILLGQLNLIARIVSMFFLISYGLLNYATWYEAHSDSPSFRPRFKWFNKYMSLAGCLVCLVIILALDLPYGLAAIGILGAIYQYVKRTAGPSRWADSGRSHSMQVIRRQLLAAADTHEHDRDWRPHILAFTKDSGRRSLLLQFAQWIVGTTGLVSAVKIIEEPIRPSNTARNAALTELKEAIHEAELNIFPLVISDTDPIHGLRILLQGYGIGPVKGNTMLCNWYGESLSSFPGLTEMKFGHSLRLAFRSGYNIVVFHGDPLRTEQFFNPQKSDRTIDVWWNSDSTSRLMLLFAHLMTRSGLWKEAAIRVLSPANTLGLTDSIELLGQQLEDARIKATPCIVEKMDVETIITESEDSELVFLPFRIKNSMLTDIDGYSLERVLTRLPPVALVMAAEDIDLDAEPEEGGAGLLAHAIDHLHDMEKRLKAVQEEHRKKSSKLDTLKGQMDTGSGYKVSIPRSELEKEITLATGEVEKSSQKVAREEAKLEDALLQVKKLSMADG